MSGLDDLLEGVQQGGGGGLGDLLGGLAGGSGPSSGSGGGLGDVFGSILGGSGSGGGTGAGALGGIAKALLPMLMGLLASGGLGKILGGMRASGFSSQADSWVGTGANERLTPDEIRQALEPGQLAAIAEQLGVSEDQAAYAVSEVLPPAVDHLTPEGHEPGDDAVDAELSRLRELLGG